MYTRIPDQIHQPKVLTIAVNDDRLPLLPQDLGGLSEPRLDFLLKIGGIGDHGIDIAPP